MATPVPVVRLASGTAGLVPVVVKGSDLTPCDSSTLTDSGNVVPRFGGALNLHVHVLALVIDSVFAPKGAGACGSIPRPC